MVTKLHPYQEFIYKDKYLAKDEEGNIIEDIPGMYKRVAKAIASVEKDKDFWEKTFNITMSNLDFLPNTPCLVNAGRPLGQLFACYVLPLEDSIEDIGQATKNLMLIQKGGGGTGFPFSKIRAEGAPVASTGGIASGVISWLKMLNSVSKSIKQGGVRRGANMGVLSVDHPEIYKFIDCKAVEGDLDFFNLSVAISDRFMEAVLADKTWDLVDPHTRKVQKTIKAKHLFWKIAEAAWRNGEPGIIFIDTINNKHSLKLLGKILATNPCGETPLLPNEACVLGSINLANMVDGGIFLWNKLKNTVQIAVRFLDNAIDASKYPVPAIEEAVKANRKIGIGVMGFADMLMDLGIPYDSEEAEKLAEDLSRFMQNVAMNYSRELAREKGPFPNYTFLEDKDYRRNATLLTIAPTGTISQIAGVFGGVEPFYEADWIRYILDENQERIPYKFSAPGKDLPHFRKASDVSAEWHIRIQAAWQKHTCNAVSKTINAPNNFKVQQVGEAIIQGWKAGLKGFTIYRDGSRESQVLVKDNSTNLDELAEIEKRQLEELSKLKEEPECST